MKHPGWVRFVPSHPDSQEGHYEEIEERADVIRGIFKLFNDGVSVYSITKRLNKNDETGIPTFAGKKWSGSLVKYYLRSRSVLGEYQPRRIINGKRIDEGEAIKDFFPAIIKKRDFDRVQARWSVVPNRNGRPPSDESDEILSGIVRCPYCSGSMGVQEGKNKHRLACNRSYENACVRVSVSRHFIEWCAAASAEEIIDSIALSESNTAAIQALEGNLSSIKKKIDNLVDLVANGVKAAEQKVNALDQEARKVSAELEQERNMELTNEADGEAFVEAFVTNKMSKEIRIKAMFHIRRFVAKVEPYFLGDQKTYDKYRADLEAAEASGVKRGSVWLKLRKKYQIEKKQFIRITFTRPIEGKTERVFTYQQYLEQMRISGVAV